MQGRDSRLVAAVLTTVFIVALGPSAAAQAPSTELMLRSEMDGGRTDARFDVRVNELEVDIDDEGRIDFTNLPTGPVEVAIPAPAAPFEVRSLTCRDIELPYEEETVVDLGPDAGGAIATIIEPVGSEVSCTVVFGRADTAVLMVEVDSFDGGLGGSFDYRLTPGLPFEGQLGSETPLRSIEAGATDTFSGVEAGPWTLALEGLPPDWEPESIECYRDLIDGGRNAFARGASLLFGLEPGYTTRCKIWVEYVEPLGPATLAIEVDSFDLDLEGDFAYRLEQGLGFDGLLGSSATAVPIEPDVWVIRDGLAPGAWTLTLETLPEGLVADAECWDTFGPIAQEAHDPAIPGSGRTVRLDLAPGTTTDCTFWLEEAAAGDVDAAAGDADAAAGDGSSSSGDPTASPVPGPSPGPDDPVDEVLAPLPGVWRSVNAKSAVRCGGVSVALPTVTDQGRIQVKKGGTRIVLPVDGRKLILDQVKGEPGRYKGKIREKSLGAILKYDVRVKNPKRLTGILRSNFSQDGRTCTLARDFDSRWVSK